MWRLIMLFMIIGSRAFAEEPVFDAIDYSNPSKYLAIHPTLGNERKISAQAVELKSTNDRKTVLSVLNWMDSRLQYDPDSAYEWRNYDTVVEQKCYGGCADQAIVCGVLLKAAGIPSVWVKTMDVQWIWDFKKKRPFKSWSGHVFLEIYIDKKWVLLNPDAKTIYPDYSPQTRILPGNRLAYHKGNDPKQMIMSLQWEDWKSQTESYFADVDESLLPVDPKSAVKLQSKCFIIANSPYYQALGEIAQRKGFTVGGSFNTDYDKNLPRTKGHTLLIETHHGVPMIETAVLERHFPKATDGLKSGRIEINDTQIMFVDLAGLLKDADAAKQADASKSPAEE